MKYLTNIKSQVDVDEEKISRLIEQIKNIDEMVKVLTECSMLYTPKQVAIHFMGAPKFELGTSIATAPSRNYKSDIELPVPMMPDIIELLINKKKNLVNSLSKIATKYEITENREIAKILSKV